MFKFNYENKDKFKINIEVERKDQLQAVSNYLKQVIKDIKFEASVVEEGEDIPFLVER